MIARLGSAMAAATKARSIAGFMDAAPVGRTKAGPDVPTIARRPPRGNLFPRTTLRSRSKCHLRRRAWNGHRLGPEEDTDVEHPCTAGGRPSPRPRPRSEEHTSELQSLMRNSYAGIY